MAKNKLLKVEVNDEVIDCLAQLIWECFVIEKINKPSEKDN